MKMLNWMVALLAVVSFSAVTTLSAQDMGGGEKEKKAEEKVEKKPAGEEDKGEKQPAGEEASDETDFAKLFKGIDEVVGKVAVTQDSIDSYVKNCASFEKAMKADKKYQELSDRK